MGPNLTVLPHKGIYFYVGILLCLEKISVFQYAIQESKLMHSMSFSNIR